MIDSPCLSLRQFRAPSAETIAPEESHLLGLFQFGQALPLASSSIPTQDIAASPLCSPDTPVCEALISAEKCISGQQDSIRFRHNRHLLFGTLTLNESDFTATPAAPPLQSATEHAYRKIFSLLAQLDYPHIWRLWNYLPAINEESFNLERYRQFNIGRQAAFTAHQRALEGSVPAACALGTSTGPLNIAFLAARTPATAIENPRQISAYHYPAEYGPRSPTFARASIAHLPEQELLFISGTASIVGHRTMHPDDVGEQTRETLRNIAALLAEANKHGNASCYSFADLDYRLYLRHPEDMETVRAVLTEFDLPADRQIAVRADICRCDLLVEIEAFATRTCAPKEKQA